MVASFPAPASRDFSLIEHVSATFKILVGVVAYRLRKLEMANLAAAASISIALHLPLVEVIWRTAFAFVLNILVYLNNDYIDVWMDLNSTGKDTEKTRYLADHLGAAVGAQVILVAVCVAAAFLLDVGLLLPLVLGGGICWWYSALLKRRPFTDILAMGVWGLAMPLCGLPWWSLLGWCMALQLGLFSNVFESIQVMRDADDDAVEGIRTTGVVLGKARTFQLARVLMILCTAYAALVLHPIAAAISAIALVIPFSEDHVARYWTQVKMTYGFTWLFICGWVFWKGQSGGLAWAIGTAARIF